MWQTITHGLELINAQFYLGSMVFFFVGYALAPWVYHKQIRVLTTYPLWIAERLEQWMEKKWPAWLLFLFILAVNSFSLAVDLFSGLLPALPFVFAVWTGLNIGIISFHTLKGKFYFASLLNPVALFELPAAFLVFTMAIQYNLTLLKAPLKPLHLSETPFAVYFNLFLLIIIPLLIIAALIETALIQYARKMEDGSRS